MLAQFLEQMQEHRDEASQAMMKMMGSEDLFTKAAVDSTLKNVSVDQMLGQRLPPEARQWLGDARASRRHRLSRRGRAGRNAGRARIGR